MHPTDYSIFKLGDLQLQCGFTLPDAFIAYKTFGKLNESKTNCIIYPSWYSGTHSDNEWLVGPDKCLNPLHYFIVIPNMLGNGLSSSPSNTPEPFNGPNFPKISLYDQVVCQHKLLSQAFAVKEIALAVGWSMGAMQAFQWACLYPDMVKRIAPFCGSAKTSVHNFVFLEGPKSALKADSAFKNGYYKNKVHAGLRAFARVYSGWGFSQEFYRKKLFLKLGYNSLEHFLVGFWEGYFLKKDPNNLLAMLDTWQNGDISDNPLYKKDFVAALNAIKAKSLVMPGETDLYFPKEDSEFEVANIKDAKLCVIPSIWGHWAGGPGTNFEDVQFIDKAISELLLAKV